MPSVPLKTDLGQNHIRAYQGNQNPRHSGDGCTAIPRIGFGQITRQMQGQVPSTLVPDVLLVDGVAFLIGNFPETEKIVNDRVDGIEHYGFVYFTQTSFEATKKTTFDGHQRTVRLVKTDNPELLEMVKFLNAFKPEQATPDITSS